ncbi:TPA: hypothetical protein ACXZU9_004703 [Salmonella enterica]
MVRLLFLPVASAPSGAVGLGDSVHNTPVLLYAVYPLRGQYPWGALLTYDIRGGVPGADGDAVQYGRRDADAGRLVAGRQ